MEELIKMFKLYSVQVITFLAGLNSLLVFWPDAPAWLVVVVNAAGWLMHNYVRKIPQPEVTAEIEALRASKK